MSSNDSQEDAGLERLLRGDPDASRPQWAATRARFVARALADGLVDVAYEDHDTPLGTVRINATSTGIVRLVLPAEDADAALDDLARKLSTRILRTSSPMVTLARQELDEYFDARRRTFDVPLDWTLSKAFRREVLQVTTQIPYGQTSSYRKVATAAGSPNAVRAAGSALATNPLPILVPCHRVLRTDGSLGQYRGGQAAKTQLLSLERTN
jgi:methylated-DNA-[protein]-cysteine S-methyltransferase